MNATARRRSRWRPQSLQQVDAALAAGADIIMLDNLDDAQMAEAVRRIAGRARVEISGGITLERMPALDGDRRRLRVGRRPHPFGTGGRYQSRSRSRRDVRAPSRRLSRTLGRAPDPVGAVRPPALRHRHRLDQHRGHGARARRARPKAPRCWPARSAPDAAGSDARGSRRRAPDCISRWSSGRGPARRDWRCSRWPPASRSPQAIEEATGLAIELKWPNDLVAGRPWRKLGGLLCEAAGSGAVR